jgi:hypothetical protein
VTPKLLSNLVENFGRFSAAGNRCPWIADHDGGADERYGDVVALRIVGDTLWATHELQEKKYQASFGEQPGDETPQEVSVDVRDNFRDGAGNFYPICLVHVANVVNPVVTNQRGFRRLSFVSKGRQMAKAAMDTATDTFTMDEVKTLLGSAGMAVPSEVDNKDKLMGYMLAQGGAEAAEPDASASSDGTATASMDPGPGLIPSGGEIKTLSLAQSRIRTVEKQLADERRMRLSLETKATEDAKSAYVGKVDSLINANRLTPAMKEGLVKAGETSKWQLSLLTPFEAMPNTAVHTTSKSRQFGNGSHGDTPDETDEQRKARAKKFAGR